MNLFLQAIKKLLLVLVLPILILTLVSAQDNLKFKLAQQKQNVGSAIVTVSITNDSNEALKVLTWNTPFEKVLSADLFHVQNGKKPAQYLGRMVKRGRPTESDYVLLKAGETRTVSIELSKYYKMELKGNYSVGYKGLFKSLTKKGKQQELKPLHKMTSTDLSISFIPAQKKTAEIAKIKVAPAYNACTQSEINIINTAQDGAINIAQNASSTMNNAATNTTGERYNTWFGAPDGTRQSTVTSHFNNLYSALNTQSYSFDCTCNESYYAYVYPSEPYTVYLCNAFWNAPVTGTDSQSGTLVHETSHFTVVAGTDDYAYGQTGGKSLAISDPNKAVFNADNHEYFAENTPYFGMGNGFDDAVRINHILNDLPLGESIDASGERDLYVFTAPRTGLYTFYTTDTLDAYGTLYNASYAMLWEDDDSGASLNFQFAYNLVEGQTYYIEVRGYSSDVGGYTLHSTGPKSSIVLIPMGDGLIIPVTFVP